MYMLVRVSRAMMSSLLTGKLNSATAVNLFQCLMRVRKIVRTFIEVD